MLGRPARSEGTRSEDERDFLRLWASDAVSQIGSQITLFALPFTAVAVLHASGDQVGVLQALYTLPFLLVPLPAGLWLDNRSLRPVLIAMNLVCAVLVTSVPVAAAAGALGLAQLYVIAVLGGAATVTSDIAKLALLPRLVPTDRLASANSRLNANLAVGSTSGPGIAGWLSALVGAPNALIADGLSYLFSAGTLSRMRYRDETRPERGEEGRNLRAEVTAGLRVVFGYAPLRNIAVHAALFNACAQFVNVALVVLLVRDRGYGGGAYGLVLVCGGIGGVTGTVSAPLLIRLLGPGSTIFMVVTAGVNAFWILPAAGGSRAAVVALCAAGLFIGSASAGVGSVVSATLRHLVSPPDLHARVNAAYRLITFGAVPVGALIGGLLVERIGAHATLWAVPPMMLVSALPLALRPVRSLRGVTRPDAEDDVPTAAREGAG
ncbi:MFS transporter [Actinomadura sp. GTD37]|uniref:MFS transporter n=1 Tax=Actinomadura sp. GTD37 TaxID=1778030 RepID=UPI0035C0A2F0